MGESMTTWFPTDKNTADLLTKFLYGSKRRHIVVNELRDIFNEH